MLVPFARTGNVATFSGGARLPKMRGPRTGGKGHQSPTTEPDGNNQRKKGKRFLMLIRGIAYEGKYVDVPSFRLNALL